MRVAVFVVFLSILATASEASQSCMTRTEAHQHFGSAHIYWHGAGHCWNAEATRLHHRIHTVRKKTDDQVREKPEHQVRPIDYQVQQKIDHPKWRESMSQMLPGDEEPVQTSWIDRWVDIGPAQSPLVARWVDIIEAAPAAIIEPESEPMVTPRSVVMAITAIVLALAILEFLIIGMRLSGDPRRWD
jgi:hypothetical protein